MAEELDALPRPSTQPQTLMTMGKKTKTQGSNFTPSEDEAVAKAFIHCSENSIKGSEQRSETFFSDVTDTYNEIFKPHSRERRSAESPKARVKLITKPCTLFSGCYGRVMRLQPTGTNALDLVRLATGRYNAKEMRNAADDCGKEFKFLSAWHVLKEHPRFSPFHATAAEDGKPENALEEKDSSSEEVTGSIEGSGGPVLPNKCSGSRPVGRTRAKKDAGKERIAQEKLKVASEALNAQRERTAVINKHYEILLFTSGPDGSGGDEAAEYFRTMRKRVVDDLRSSEKKRQRLGSPNDSTQPSATAIDSIDDAGSHERT